LSKGVAMIVMSHRDGAEMALAQPEVDICGIPAKLQWSTMVKQEMGLLKTRDEEKPDGEGASSRRKFQEGSEGASAAPAADGTFRVGQSVLVSGLKSAPQFNGTVGIVQGVRGDGRCEVLLQLESETKTLALKVDNLTDATSTGGGGEGGAAVAPEEAEPPRRRFQDAAGTSGDRNEDASSGGGQADGKKSSEATPAGEEDGGRRRRRKSAWGENQGGEVYVGAGSKAAAEEPQASASAAAEPLEPVPSEEALAAMSAKELKKLLVSHKVDTVDCIERGDYLEKARKLARG